MKSEGCLHLPGQGASAHDLKTEVKSAFALLFPFFGMKSEGCLRLPCQHQIFILDTNEAMCMCVCKR
eukprot:531544-Pelagomonas_calceolata.AAC.2